jgi:hypothetical protein
VNHVRTLLLLVSVACTWACTVPTLEDVEREEERGKCDATHPCEKGWYCFDGACFAEREVSCRPAQTQTCVNQQGVCQGAVEVCSGSFKGCTPETFASHAPQQYQRFELRCDRLDNDCNGVPDGWEPVHLNEASTSFTLAATAVKRDTLGKPNTVVTLVPEEGGLKVRLLSSEGAQESGKFAPTSLNATLESPALSAEGDLVAAGWIEHDPRSLATAYSVQLAMLDGGGALKREKVELYKTDNLRPISQVRVVMGRTHVLVLMELTVNFVQEFWVITIERTLDLRTRSAPLKLGTSRVSKWFNGAVVRGPDEHFLVTYNDGGERRLVRISTAGQLMEPPLAMPVVLNSAAEMPFIVPVNPTSSRHTIFYVEDNLQGFFNIRYVKCDTQVCETPQMALENFDRRLTGLQLATVPGEPAPILMILSWSAPNQNDPNGPEVQGHTLAPMLGDKAGSLHPFAIRAPKVYSPVFGLTADRTAYVAYLEDGPPPPPQAGPTTPVARLQPFCAPL